MYPYLIQYKGKSYITDADSQYIAEDKFVAEYELEKTDNDDFIVFRLDSVEEYQNEDDVIFF